MSDPTTDTTAKIPETCPKCGRSAPEYRYDEVHNEMAMHCLCCGYRWCVTPLDRLVELVQTQENASRMREMWNQIQNARVTGNAHEYASITPKPVPTPTPTEPVRVYNTHPEVREHIRAAMQYIEQAESLHNEKKRGMSGALCNAIRELRAAEVLL